jgi:hypothetical protein
MAHHERLADELGIAHQVHRQQTEAHLYHVAPLGREPGKEPQRIPAARQQVLTRVPCRRPGGTAVRASGFGARGY